MQCDSTISIEKEERNSEKASVPSIDQISSTHFHSIFPFHFASSNPSFFIDPIASTISNKRFFFFIIHTGIRLEAMVLFPFRLNSIMIVPSILRMISTSLSLFQHSIRGISSLDFSTRFTPSTGCESEIITLEQRSNPLRDTPNRSS